QLFLEGALLSLVQSFYLLRAGHNGRWFVLLIQHRVGHVRQTLAKSSVSQAPMALAASRRRRLRSVSLPPPTERRGPFRSCIQPESLVCRTLQKRVPKPSKD